jgi:hypothetical protein
MDVSKAQSFTIQRYFNLKTFTLPVVNLGTADASGLVADPNNPGVFYRPGVVNLSPSQPAGTPEYHTFNWGGYGSVQAKPEPTQIIDNASYGPPAVDGGEIIIAPAMDAPSQQSAKPMSPTKGETVDTKV